jgi:hypothetical protein
MDYMTPRARWVAALKCQPVDRLPFWPKVFDASYMQAQVAPFNTMTIAQIQQWVGSDDHIQFPPPIRQVHRRTQVVSESNGNRRRTVFTTPHGSTEFVEQFDPVTCSWHPTRFPIQTLSDVELMIEVYADCVPELDGQILQDVTDAVRRIGESASTWSPIGESPLMYWLEYEAGIDRGHYLLVDHRESVEQLFAARHRVLCRKTEIMADKCPTDFLYFVENTSTTLISPKQFRQYCLQHLTDYARIACQSNRLMVLHMCGHLKALLSDLATIAVTAFEAFTSPPVGNTTFLDGRVKCPDKGLAGGTNATLWLESPQTIIEQLKHDLDVLPHHRGIVVTSGGLLPPPCSPETLKTVCEWVKRYPVRV